MIRQTWPSALAKALGSHRARARSLARLGSGVALVLALLGCARAFYIVTVGEDGATRAVLFGLGSAGVWLIARVAAVASISPASISALLFVGASVLYLSNGHTLGSGDTLPARYLPFSILRDGDFYLDEVVGALKPSARHSVRMVEPRWKGRPAPPASPEQHVLLGRHFVSAYPIGSALMAIPFFIPSALGGATNDDALLEDIEKLSAAIITSLSVAVLFLTCARMTSRKASLYIAAMYALGTSSLSVSSQGLWQHGPSQLALSVVFYCLVRARSEDRWAAFSAFAMAFSVLCRPTNIFLAIPLCLYLLHRHRNQLIQAAIMGMPPALFQIWYNLRYFGEPFHSQFPLFKGSLWSTPLWDGLAGLLVSPGRGLFVYSPFLVFSLLGFAWAWRRDTNPPVQLLHRYSSLGAILVILVHSKWWSWWGGYCYGPRVLADLLPLLSLAICPIADMILAKRPWKAVASILALWSFLTHFQGAYWDDGRWTGYARPEGLWSWTDSPLTNPARILVNRARILASGAHTTSTHPEEAAASYSPAQSDTRYKGTAGDQIRVRLAVTNIGTAVWNAWPKQQKGSARLEYALTAVSSPQSSCRHASIPLRHDVFPGDTYEFQIRLVLPGERGEYLLKAGLVIMPNLPIGRGNSHEIEIPVRVMLPAKEDRPRQFLVIEGE